MFDIHRFILDRHGKIDEEQIEKYIDGLMEEFVVSAEAQPVLDEFGDRGFSALMMEYAINYLGVTPHKMSLPEFNEVVFQLFPRKVSTEPESAAAIVAELRAFWNFLHRQYGLANAVPIAGSLTNAAVKRLERELANPANYGIAKSFVMRGMAAGYDMTTQEGSAAFMAAYNSSLAGVDVREIEDVSLPPMMGDFPSPLSPKQRAEKRKKRKSQRQARKRNRK